MKKFTLIAMLFAVTAANAGVVRFSAKHGSQFAKKVGKVGFKVAKRVSKIVY